MKILKWILLGVVLIQFIPYGHSHTNPPARGEPSWNSPQTRELIRVLSARVRTRKICLN